MHSRETNKIRSIPIKQPVRMMWENAVHIKKGEAQANQVNEGCEVDVIVIGMGSDDKLVGGLESNGGPEIA